MVRESTGGGKPQRRRSGRPALSCLRRVARLPWEHRTHGLTLGVGLLDELEQEAERRRAEQAASEALRGDREATWKQVLGPAMVELAGYLEKLTANLGFLKRRARFVFELPGYGPVVAYAEPEFQLRSTPGRNSHEITLEYVAQVAQDECPVLDVEGVTRVRALSAAFQQHRLSGMQDARKGANGEPVAARFHARGRIPLKVVVSADQDSCVARMQFQNMEGFGATGRSFAAEQMTAELFDALGRFITREDLDFGREHLPDDVRQQLRSRVERDQLKREWENRLSTQLEEDEARVLATMAGAGSWMGRLRLAALRLVRR